MNIETGKYYVTRDGRKVRIYATDGAPDYPIHGSALSKDGQWYHLCWSKNGLYLPPKTDFAADIVGPWAEKPVIDVPSMPAWTSWAAMDSDGVWHAYRVEPEAESAVWAVSEGYINYTRIPPSHAPKWEGDWKESLVKFR